MPKNLLLIFGFIAFSVVSTFAQKIAIVDVNSILAELGDYKQAEKELDTVAAEWQQEIAQEYDKIKSLYNKFQAEQVLLSDDIRKQREEEILAKEKEVRNLQRTRFGPEGDLFTKRQQLVSPIQDKVFSAIESYANERGFDIILDKSSSAGILFASEAYDKTDIVKRRLGIK